MQDLMRREKVKGVERMWKGTSEVTKQILNVDLGFAGVDFGALSIAAEFVTIDTAFRSRTPQLFPPILLPACLACAKCGCCRWYQTW